MLITVNMKYYYRLDIIENRKVKSFTKEILRSDKIKSITVINEDHAISLMGSAAKNGWIIIKLKPNINLDFEVGGLKYINGKKRQGGNNFLKMKEGDLMIRK